MGFLDPVVAGVNLIRAAIRSPNYVTGVSGWTINVDGSAEFNNLTIRGTFFGTDYILNSTGLFMYSGTPASGNLIVAVAPAAGTDSFGNSVLKGLTVYPLNDTGTVVNVGLSAGGFPGFVFHNVTHPASIDPFIGGQSNPSGTGTGNLLSLASGNKASGVEAIIEIDDDVQFNAEAGVSSAAIQLIADVVTLVTASGSAGTPYLHLVRVGSGNPGTALGGGNLYAATDGSLHYIGGSGTNTQIAPA